MRDETIDNQQERLTETDLAWLAGMWEADGSFSLNRIYNNSKLMQYEPRMQYVNTDIKLVHEVMRILKLGNIGYYQISRIQTGIGKKIIHMISVQGMKRCATFLRLVLPHVRGAKRQRSQYIQDFVDLRLSKPKNQRYGDAEHKIYEAYDSYNKSVNEESSTTNMPNAA